MADYGVPPNPPYEKSTYTCSAISAIYSPARVEMLDLTPDLNPGLSQAAQRAVQRRMAERVAFAQQPLRRYALPLQQQIGQPGVGNPYGRPSTDAATRLNRAWLTLSGAVKL